ncbi:plexin-B3-like, partial [Ruditapes philippinarum]|uniref:plexin-B3-like n=1 Tax=Ruditapes philippinarum TaxID=129788 RepID=UPI00295B50DE
MLEDNSDLHYIPTDVESAVTIRGSNLPNASSFWCYIKENSEYEQPASKEGDSITCSLTVKLKNSTAHKEKVRVVVKYGQSKDSRKILDDDHNLTVTVYSCDNLAKDCSHCKGLNTSRYKCRWCPNSCQHIKTCSSHKACPAPFIEKISPSDGPVGGNTTVTINGTNLGTTLSQIDSVKIGTYTCNVSTSISFPENDDFELDVPNRIECTIVKTNSKTEETCNVKVIVNELESNQNVSYTFKVPTVTGINPSSGPKAGGTKITISGKNLGIGNKIWNVTLGPQYYIDIEAKPVPNSNLFTIECVTQIYTEVGNQTLLLLEMDGNKFFVQNIITFETLTNPNISEIEGKKGGFLKGGTILTILGTDLHHANVGVVKFQYKNDKVEEKCEIESNAVTKCLIPVAPQSLRNDVMAKVNQSSNRRKRAACDGCIEVTVTVKLDGVEKDFIIKYVQDPTVQKLSGDGNVLLYETDEHQLILKGDALDLVTIKTDFRVSIGTANCTVIELTRDTLTCKPPTSQPSPANPKKHEFPEVEVYVGNIHERVGYLQYQKTVELFIIALAAGGGALLILMIIIVVGIVKYKKMGNKARAYEKNLIDMEMEIKTVARQEFLDMHTTMSSVNKNLVEQGFPYHTYQQFACNVMFSVDYLWTEPVVSNGKMTDDERLKANRGMESLESLI